MHNNDNNKDLNLDDAIDADMQNWSTGIYASAAMKSALHALITNEFIDPVGIILPDGSVPYFILAMESLGEGYASAGISKEADENTGATTIIATVFPAPPATGIQFQAGDGVGTLTHDGLNLAAGEAAISLEIREKMSAIAIELCEQYELTADLLIMISAISSDNLADHTTTIDPKIEGGIAIR